MILIIGGGTGGVGRSFIACCAVHYFSITRRATVTIIDTDPANPDVKEIYANGHDTVIKELLKMDVRNTWVEFANLIEKLHKRTQVFVLNTHALFNESLIDHSGDFLKGIEDMLKRPNVTLYVLSTARDSVQAMEDYQQAFPNRHIHVILNGFWGPENSFSLYHESSVKREIEAKGGRTIYFPKLDPNLVEEMFNKRTSFDKMLNGALLGTRLEIEGYLREIDSIFNGLLGDDQLLYHK